MFKVTYSLVLKEISIPSIFVILVFKLVNTGHYFYYRYWLFWKDVTIL